MRDFRRHVSVLATLHELDSERMAAFRRGMASLAQVAMDPAAVPFEGVDAAALLSSVRVALGEGWLEDLSFLPTSSAPSALYALAMALPAHGIERRELGRRIIAQVHHCDASSFVAVATALALGSTRAFEGSALRGRIGVMLSIPASDAPNADPLAFALLSRRELCARFLIEPAGQDLPARRTAARLLECAARYASLRAQHGDDCELATFEASHVSQLFTRLLFDREPSVFRHAAGARGLLAAHVPRYAEDLEQDLAAKDAPSRTRRGALSLAALVAVRPEQAFARAVELLRGVAAQRDPGLPATLIQGLVRVAALEPEITRRVLLEAIARGGALAVEALVDLRRDLVDDDVRALDAARTLIAQLEANTVTDEDQLDYLAMLRDELEPTEEHRNESVSHALSVALIAYGRSGPSAALEPARHAIQLAHRAVEQLSSLDPSQGKRGRRDLFRLLYELDVVLLDAAAWFDMLGSPNGGAEAERSRAQLTTLLTQLLGALMAHEELPHAGDGAVPHLALRMRRLRLLMHLLDTDLSPSDEQREGVREQLVSAVRGLSQRIASDRPSAMDRVVHATLARGFEALLRGEMFELADLVLCTAQSLPRSEAVHAVSEGCLLPEVKQILRALVALLASLEDQSTHPRSLVIELANVAHALPSDASPRTEALRRALLALERALESLLTASSLLELVRSRRALTLFESALIELAYLHRGARRRIGEDVTGPIIDESPVASVARALESAVAQGESADLRPTLEWLDRELSRVLPLPLALTIARVLGSLRELPLEAVPTGEAPLSRTASTETCPLPAWLPSSRRLGAFSVLRPLGTGLGGSVFLVQRTDERHGCSTPIALKVPRYDGRAARVLSASEFDAAFSRELPCLMRVPPSEHVASFLSIETKNAPRPFLVMEYVEGPTLARVRKRQLDPIHLLDGVLAGLEHLHGVGIGHLDLTPSRVVLRKRANDITPVLVDFGFAGRHVRAGCGEASYRAPELWRDDVTNVAPEPVDVYAVGCLAYELLTGRPLFHAPSEAQIASAHGEHDGAPKAVLELAHEPRHARIAEWIVLCLRQDPRVRPSAAELRKTLRFLVAG